MEEHDLLELLDKNTTVVVLFVTATWCSPCSSIIPYVHPKLKQLNGTVVFVDADRDFEIFRVLKRLKQLKGVPTLLAYTAGNKTLASNYCVSGTSRPDIDAFFLKIQSA